MGLLFYVKGRWRWQRDHENPPGARTSGKLTFRAVLSEPLLLV